MANLVELSLNNRFIVPNDLVKSMMLNNETLLTNLEKAADYHKKNLLTVGSKKQDSVANYLRDLADSSFNIELSLYEKVDMQFASAIKSRYESSKTSNYLVGTYTNGVSYGLALTNLFYGGKGETINTSLSTLLQDLAHLDPHLLIKMTEISNDKMVANIIATNIDNFMRELKIEKNIAAEIGGDTALVFSVLFDESNIMNVILEEDLKETEIKKVIKKSLSELLSSKEFLSLDRKGRQEKMMEIIGASKEEAKDAISFLVNELVDKIYQEIAPYRKKGIGKKTLLKAILELLKSGKKSKKNNEDLGFSYTRLGALLKKNGLSVFSLASYKLDIDKITSTFSGYLAENSSKNIETIDIKDFINGDFFDEAMIVALLGYNEALLKYLLSRGHGDAWDYYVKYFLQQVIDMAKRDYQDEKVNSEPISNISSEIRKGINALLIAHSIDNIITKIKDLKETLDDKLTKNELNEIIEMAANFLNKNDDRIILLEIKNLIDSGSISLGIAKLSERLTSKRAGFISNFNGSIGEIFITAIIAVVFKGKITDVYQKGSSTNLRGLSAHADITIDKIGIQSKIYKDNDISLYKNTTVTFKSDDALRYLRTRNITSKSVVEGDELSSFRFFLLNNTILQDIGSSGAVTDNFFLDALNLRLENFIRYSDGLTKLGEIKNNFYLINFNIVPASVIFLKMAEMFDDDKIPQDNLISFSNLVNKNLLALYYNDNDSGYLLNNSNVLSLLGGSNATFKSFVLKLSDLGVNIY